MKTNVILIGELKIGDGVVHQKDYAEALGAERLTQWPKSMDDVQVIVGRLLANRKPAMLIRCEKNQIATVTVDSTLAPEVTSKLITLLEAKAKRETYEERALLALKATAAPPVKSLDTTLLADVFPMPPKRGKKSKKAASNA